MNLSIAPPPDPLRRFVETPLCDTIGNGAYEWKVSTNDPLILDVIRSVARSLAIASSLDWVVICEDEIAYEGNTTRLVMGVPGCVVTTIGDACLMAFDRERGTVYGFVGRNVPASLFQQLCCEALSKIDKKHAAGECR